MCWSYLTHFLSSHKYAMFVHMTTYSIVFHSSYWFTWCSYQSFCGSLGFPWTCFKPFFKTGFILLNSQFFGAKAAIRERLLHATVKSSFKTRNCFRMKRWNSSLQLCCCLPLYLKSVCRTRWLLHKSLKRLDLDALGAFVTAVCQILV